MFFVYIIKSLKNKRYYIGSTNNIKRRIKEHNKGKNKYTSLTKPFLLVYKEKYKTLSEARKRETYLKKLKSRKYIEWLIKESRKEKKNKKGD